MPKAESNVKQYQCSICKLHYTSKGLADECYRWCSGHSSCNLKVASRSIEAKKARGTPNGK